MKEQSWCTQSVIGGILFPSPSKKKKDKKSEIITPSVPQNMTISGNAVFTKVTKLK